MIGRVLDIQILLYCMLLSGLVGAVGMFLTNRRYRKKVKENNVEAFTHKKETVSQEFWENRSRLLHRMNRWVWYPSLSCIFFLGAAVILAWRGGPGDTLPLHYFYAGMMIPVCLLLLRQGLDFSYRGEWLIDAAVEYAGEFKDTMEEKQVDSLPPKAREEVVEHIARSIKESAATKGHFSQMLSPEEEAIMREVIKEFME